MPVARTRGPVSSACIDPWRARRRPDRSCRRPTPTSSRNPAPTCVQACARVVAARAFCQNVSDHFVSRALFEHVWHAGLVTRLRTFRHRGFCEFARRAPHEPCATVLIGNLLESRENVPSSATSSLLTLIIMSCGRQVVHIDIIGKRCALLPPAHRPHTHTHCPCCRRPRKGQQEGLASTSFCMAVCMSSRTVHSPISTCMHIYKCVLARTRLFTCALSRVAHVLNC